MVSAIRKELSRFQHVHVQIDSELDTCTCKFARNYLYTGFDAIQSVLVGFSMELQRFQHVHMQMSKEL